MSIRVLLAEDHAIVREGLRSLLESADGMHVVAEAANGRDAVALASEHAPDVVVMDVMMPGLNGIEATRRVRRECPATKVVALSMHAERVFVTEMLRAGASGYLLKDCVFDELARAICAVASGRSYLGEGVAGVVVDALLDGGRDGKGTLYRLLTAREREVLQLVAEGRSTRDIAGLLHVSVKTVETHRRRIMGKLDLHSVAELTRYAVQQGLTKLAV